MAATRFALSYDALKIWANTAFTRNPNHYDNSLIAVVPPSALIAKKKYYG